MALAFTKMQGLGNDFVVVDALRQSFAPDAATCRALADRRFGIGCDQILLVEAPRLPGTRFHYRIFNADGSEVEQCGNGARCFARFVREQGLSDEDEISVGTAGGVIRLYHEPGDQVRVNMGRPRFEPSEIPLDRPARADRYRLELDGQPVEFGAVSMGNPHAVLLVEDVDHAPVAELGPALERHSLFPSRVNVGFLQVVDASRVRLRVFERGSGETLACGTGACAAVAVGRQLGLLGQQVRVELPGGALQIAWDGGAGPVWMTGPAVTVFSGEIDLATLQASQPETNPAARAA